MNATNLVYNNVTITNCRTLKFEQSPERDDSNTDTLFHRFRIRIVGWVHTYASPPTINISTNTYGTTAANQVNLRRRLMEDRKSFSMTVGGNTLLSVSPPGGPVSSSDVNNGPKPIDCAVTQIAGAASMKVEFEIELAIVDCQTVSNTQGVLNNRWSMEDDTDVNWYRTRTVRGKLRIANQALNPQSFRALIMPTLQGGFRRERITLVTSLDGLTLEYLIVDREISDSAPFPSTTWEGRFVKSTTDGVTTYGEIDLRFTAPPGVSRVDLMALAAAIGEQKLQLAAGKNVLQQAALIEHLHENIVEFRASALLVPTNPLDVFAIGTDGLGVPLALPGYDPLVSAVPGDFGSGSPTQLFVAYLQSPCDDNHQMPQVSTLQQTSGNPGAGTSSISTVPPESLPVDSTIEANYSSSHFLNPYTHYRIDAGYDYDQNVVQMPIASAVIGSQNDTTDTCVTIQLARPTAKRVVRVEAERVGAWPEMPAAMTTAMGSIPLTLKRAKITPRAPKLTGDGQTVLYASDAEYEHAMSRPTVAGESLDTGALPWMNTSIAATQMPPTILTSSIVQ